MLSSDIKSEIDKSNTLYGRFGQNMSQLKQVAAAAQNRMSNNMSATKDNATNDEEVQPGMTVDGVYNELIHLRKMNKILGDRIKQLEVMNFRMTNQGFMNAKNQK